MQGTNVDAGPHIVHGPRQVAPSNAERAYPEPLQRAEEVLIQKRQAQLMGAPPPEGYRVGVALSGGGVRSATFALGFFQALAQKHLVRRIDFLSTVSGGGYFGGFLGALYRRARVASSADVEAILSNDDDDALQYLRENGRYLAPAGKDDLLLGAAVLCRNWVALQVVLLSLALFALLSLHAATIALRSLSPQIEGPVAMQNPLPQRR